MVFSWVSALAKMEVYPEASALLGPSVPIHDDVKLHRLFERNANSYPGHMAVVHEGERFDENAYVRVYTLRTLKAGLVFGATPCVIHGIRKCVVTNG